MFKMKNSIRLASIFIIYKLYYFCNVFEGSYGPSNNYRSQPPNMQVPNDLVMKLMEAQQVNIYMFE